MILLRLSGHSGAGKSRLTAALRKRGIACPQAVLYTSRGAREGEVHGRDYYFLSRGAIENLRGDSFFVGSVRDMVQAVDLMQLESDLRGNELVLIEIFHTMWAGLVHAISKKLGPDLRTASVFMSAIDPDGLASAPKEQVADQIRAEVTRILEWRAKDPRTKIASRAASAVEEVLGAVSVPSPYDLVLHSSPEGPDGEDDWTRAADPVGDAAKALDKFIAFFISRGHVCSGSRVHAP